MKGSRTGYLTAGIFGGTLFAVGTLSISRYHREIQARREYLDSLENQVLSTDFGPVEYARTGSGYPILVIHGNGGGFDQGLGLAQSYIGQGYQFIAPSRFGYLGSPLPDGATPAMQADVYARLLDSLDIDRAAIFTTSAGVTSSIQFALRHPERLTAMVFTSPNGPGEEGLVPPPKAIFRMMMGSDYVYWALITYFGSRMQSLVGVPKEFSLTLEHKTDIQATMRSVLPVSKRGEGMVFDTFFSNPEINNYPLGEVKTPTLVISAVDDPMALHENAVALADQMPHARLLAIPDGGHILLGRTNEVKSAVVEFLHENLIQ